MNIVEFLPATHSPRNLPPFNFLLQYWTVDVANPQMAQGAGPALSFIE